MYSLNLLSCNVLTTCDECAQLFSGSAIDPKKWLGSIQIAEERFVVDVLGYSFYRQLVAQKNVTVTTGNQALLQGYVNAQFGYQPGSGAPVVQLVEGMTVNSIDLPTVSAANRALWNQVLWRFVFECVQFMALTDNYAQFTTAGVVKNNPISSLVPGYSSNKGDSVGIDLRDIKYLNDRALLDKINPLQRSLELYLCINQGAYPLFDVARCDKDGGQLKRTTPFVNIYDDDEDCGCAGSNEGAQALPVPAGVPVPSTRACSLVATIRDEPDASLQYLLCNLQTVPAEYPVGDTLVIPHLAGKTILYPVFVDNAPVGYMPFDGSTGTFDATGIGGLIDGNKFIVNYNEVMP